MNKYAEEMEKIALNRLEREAIAGKWPLAKIQAMVDAGHMRPAEQKAVGSLYGVRQMTAKRVDGPNAPFSPGVFEDMPEIDLKNDAGKRSVDAYVPGAHSHGKVYGPQEFRDLWKKDPYQTELDAAKSLNPAEHVMTRLSIRDRRERDNMKALALGVVGARPSLEHPTRESLKQYALEVANPSRLPVLGKFFSKPEQVPVGKPLLNISKARAANSQLMPGIYARESMVSPEYTVKSPALHATHGGSGLGSLDSLADAASTAHELFEADAGSRMIQGYLPDSGSRPQIASAWMRGHLGDGRKTRSMTGHAAPSVLLRERDRLSKDVYAHISKGHAGGNKSDIIHALGMGGIRKATREDVLIPYLEKKYGRRRVMGALGKESDRMFTEGAEYLKKETGKKFDPRQGLMAADAQAIKGGNYASTAPYYAPSRKSSYSDWAKKYGVHPAAAAAVSGAIYGT